MQILKYRPVLTSTQIAHVITLCKKDLSGESLLVISTLAPFMAKIENNGITPAYKIQEKISLEYSLGIEERKEALLIYDAELKLVYEKWVNNVNDCNAIELEKVKEYRCQEGMMSEEEYLQYNNEFADKMELEVEKERARLAKLSRSF